MALVNMISYSLLDIRGQRGQVQVFVPQAATIAQITALSDLVAAALDDVTGAKIVSASVSMAIELPAGLKSTATQDCFVQTGLNLAFDAANTGYRHTAHIPALLPTLITDGEIDDSGNLIDALSTLFTAGDTTTLPTDSNGNDLVSELGRSLSFRRK